MIQIVGVLILAMDIEPMFHSLVEGDHVDNAVMVGGYVIMRLALVSQWLRALAVPIVIDERRGSGRLDRALEKLEAEATAPRPS